MKQIIKDAIQHKQVLAIKYHGYARTIEPHTYGVDAHGVEKLRAYQTGGGSRSGDVVDWKIFMVAEITSIAKTGSVFLRARPNYVREDEAIKKIYAQL